MTSVIPSPYMKTRKILIVDDEADATRLLKILLEKTGKFTVSVENDATHALQKTAELKPDLILMDIVMPHIDGTTIAASIRSHDQLKKTPIIYLTGIVPKENSMPHKKLGGYPFIAKPIDLQEVIDCIELNLSEA